MRPDPSVGSFTPHLSPQVLSSASPTSLDLASHSSQSSGPSCPQPSSFHRTLPRLLTTLTAGAVVLRLGTSLSPPATYCSTLVLGLPQGKFRDSAEVRALGTSPPGPCAAALSPAVTQCFIHERLACVAMSLRGRLCPSSLFLCPQYPLSLAPQRREKGSSEPQCPPGLPA